MHFWTGEEVESPAEEEEELDPEELADIEEERREMEEEAFRAARWPAYVQYIDSLVRQIDLRKLPLLNTL